MGWKVDVSLISDWLDSQSPRRIASIVAAIEMLEKEGPVLGRPLVDRIKGSRLHNLKELRPVVESGEEVRILFLFDENREAVMLVAGDKATGKNNSCKWSGWYKRNIPIAEERYRKYREDMRS